MFCCTSECPLLALSRHSVMHASCPLSSQHRLAALTVAPKVDNSALFGRRATRLADFLTFMAHTRKPPGGEPPGGCRDVMPRSDDQGRKSR